MNLSTVRLIAYIVLVIDLMFLTFMIGLYIGQEGIESFTMKNILKDNTQPLLCSNLSLEQTVACLNNNFNSWYIYNLSNVNMSYNESSLKSLGGVCWHAATWYDNKLQALNYSTLHVTLRLKEIGHAGHEFLVTWNENVSEYCIVDQRSVKCQKLS